MPGTTGGKRPAAPYRPPTTGFNSGVRRKRPTTVAPAFSRSSVQELLSSFQRAAADNTPEATKAANYYSSKLAMPNTPMTVASAPNTQVARGAAPSIQTSVAQSTPLNQQSSVGGGNANSTTPPQGDAMDGFARRYAPDQADMLLSNPDVILRDYLGQDGAHNYINQEGDMSRYAQAAPGLYNILTAGNMGTGQANDKIINYVADLMKNISTEGGRTPDVGQLVSQFMAGLGSKNSTLQNTLMYDANGNPVDTATQVANITKMIPYLGTFSNYNMSTAMQTQAKRLGNEYMSAVANGDANGQTFADYLQSHFLKG